MEWWTGIVEWTTGIVEWIGIRMRTTARCARSNLSRSLRLHLPAHRFISGQPQACTAHSPTLLDDDDDDSDREAVWTPVIKVEASPVKVLPGDGLK